MCIRVINVGHDVGEREEYVAQVVPSRSVAQKRAELPLRTAAVDGGSLCVCGGISLQHVQPQSPQGVDDGARAGDVGGSNGSADLLQSALQVDDEV